MENANSVDLTPSPFPKKEGEQEFRFPLPS